MNTEDNLAPHCNQKKHRSLEIGAAFRFPQGKDEQPLICRHYRCRFSTSGQPFWAIADCPRCHHQCPKPEVIPDFLAYEQQVVATSLATIKESGITTNPEPITCVSVAKEWISLLNVGSSQIMILENYLRRSLAAYSVTMPGKFRNPLQASKERRQACLLSCGSKDATRRGFASQMAAAGVDSKTQCGRIPITHPVTFGRGSSAAVAFVARIQQQLMVLDCNAIAQLGTTFFSLLDQSLLHTVGCLARGVSR